MTEKQLKDAIESFLDAQPNVGFDGLSTVFAITADLCREKAAHVQENWQDEGLAYLWGRYGDACDKGREAYDRAAARID